MRMTENSHVVVIGGGFSGAAELASLITENRAVPRPAHWMPVPAITHVPQRPPWDRLNTPPRLLRNTGERLQ
jgi:hypothetical protein